MLFQTCMSLCLLLSTKEDILKNVGIKQWTVPIDLQINASQWLTINYLVTNIL